MRSSLRERFASIMTDSVLNLWRKNLGTVPEETWDNSAITVLILADNGLESISRRIGELRHLRTLDLGHNRLAKLPDELGILVELGDFLYLHDNQLDSLPPSMKSLHKLRYLNISENRFSLFPDAVCEMCGLVELRVTHNQLRNIPDSLAKLSRLRELHLRNNCLRTLPSSVGQLPELRQIDLRGNPIEQLPDSILEMPRLEKLDLRWVDWLPAKAWLTTLEDRGCVVYR
jgi:Leucine-rich repeat (LRR) protein